MFLSGLQAGERVTFRTPSSFSNPTYSLPKGHFLIYKLRNSRVLQKEQLKEDK